MASRHHVFVGYSPHVNAMTVQALPASTEYDGKPPQSVLLDTQTIYLDWDNADERLAEVLAMIEELES